MHKTKILVITHTPTATTGYGRVVRRFAHVFHQAGNGILAMAAGYRGGPHELPYPLVPWDGLSAEPILRCVEDSRAGILLTIGDPWMFERLASIQRGSWKWVAYFPVDGYP
jgi:hypothetical protein